MPMDRRLYPDNWEAIAHQVKEEAGWHCQQCQQLCRKPGQSWAEFQALRRQEGRALRPDARPGRFTLTVAHLDHCPSNCDRSNLKALCGPCHCRYDLSQMGLKRRLKRERFGQLTLEGVLHEG